MTDQVPPVSPVFLPLDRPNLAAARALASPLVGDLGGLKIGLELFLAEGPSVVHAFKATGLPVFLDLKLHDIPNTVAGAVRSLASTKADFLTLHATGGTAMLKAAVEATHDMAAPPTLLAVTVLTSLNDADLTATGVAASSGDQVLRLTELALDAGVPGIVCSPLDIAPIRARFGSAPALMVPGIRPNTGVNDDQKRTLTPAEAMAAGANYLVIGRPISQAADPLANLQAINATVGMAA